MKRILRLTEGDLHRIIKESVRRILKEDKITYQGDSESEEWDEAGISPYDFELVENPEIAEFHSAKQGFDILYGGDEFGEAWVERDGLMRGNSEDEVFGGYTRCFLGYGVDGLIEDILDKMADAILNPEDDEYYDDDEDDIW